MANKCNLKSIRMTDEVLRYVNNFEGNGFNEKFENLVLWCMKTEDQRRAKLAYYDTEIKRASDVLDDFERLGRYLCDLENHLSSACQVAMDAAELTYRE